MSQHHDEIQSLLAPHALHAVEPEEAVAIEAHLPTCPRCRSELEGYLRTAPLLGSVVGDVPAGVWEEVLRTVDDRRKATVPVWVHGARPRRSSSRGRSLVAIAAAVAVLVGVASGALVAGLGGSSGGSTTQRLQAAASAVLSGPHTLVDMRDPSGGVVAEVAISRSSDAFFLPVSLPRLHAGRTYQLWASVRGSPVSLGVLGSSGALSEFRAQPEMTMFMITAEPSGGVPEPDSPVLAAGRVT
jgi:anti-sigma factor RsiW